MSDSSRYGRAIYGTSRYGVHRVGDVVRVHDDADRVFIVEPRLWRSDLTRSRLESIPVAKPLDATVTFNEDMAYKRQMSIDVLHPLELQPLGDFVIPEIVITDQYENESVIALGHFVVTDPSVETFTTHQQGRIEARDVTYLLDLSTLDDPITVPIGVDPALYAIDLLLQFGLTREMINIPAANVLTTKELYFEEGDSMYEVVNGLMHAGGMLNIWTDGIGRVESTKSRDLSNATADVVYSSDDGARLSAHISESRDLSRLRNRVTVRKVSTNEPTIAVTLDVTDETSPVHPLRLQELMNAPRPIIIGHTVEDHDVIDEATATAVAEGLISTGSSFYQTLGITTLIEQGFDAHRVIGLDVRDGDFTYYAGNWLRRTWTIRMSGASATLEHELNRIERWR